MTPRRRAALQADILHRVKAADKTWTDEALGTAMDCHRTMVSHYRSGRRLLDLAELAGLLAAGADPEAVLGPLAELAGARVELVEVEAADEHRLPVEAARLVALGAEFSASVAQAFADGRLTEDERDDLDRRHDQLLAETRRLSLRRAS